jgi:hypothetical protein
MENEMSETTTIEHRAAAWIVGRDTGSSSKALWAVMMGVDGGGAYPSDGGDLGRCLRLLEAVPEWRARLPEMAAKNDYWGALVKHWDELEALHAKAVDRDDYKPLYGRMKQILDPIADRDPRVIRLGGGASVRFGRP